MTDKISVEQAIARGNTSLSIIDDPVFVSAVDKAKGAIVERWKLADTPQKRETQHAQLMALELVVIELMTFANDGKYLQQQLDTGDKRRAVRGPGAS